MFQLTPTIVFALSVFAADGGSYRFQSGEVAWKAMSPGRLAANLVQHAGSASTSHALVRFNSPLNPADRAACEMAGLTVLSPLGGGTYMAAIDPAALSVAGVLRAADMQELRPVEPQWKLHWSLAEDRVPLWTVQPRDRIRANPTVAVYVLFHQDVDLDSASSDAVTMVGGKARSVLQSINGLVLELPYESIWTLIEDDRVLYVEPALPKFSELNDSNRALTQADEVQQFPYSLDGDGVVVMVYDGGYGLSSHADFGGRHTTRDSSSLSDHATHVAGTIGGDGSLSGGAYRGMAPAVTIESYGFEQEGGLHEGFLYSDPGDLEQDYSDAINNHGAVLANNSIGTNTAPNGFPCEWTGDYGVTSNLIDTVVTGGLGGDIRTIWANGNERQTSNCGDSYHSTAPPACAKNHITVGAINSNDESMTYFSSWGPADDGRIKPDISAPGCQSDADGGVTSCSAYGDYTVKCGTSMACPTVTGLSALILQDYRQWHPMSPDMESHTLKALLAHTAADKFNTGPDYQYGYGSVRVREAIDHMASENFLEGDISGGETLEYLVYVQAGDGDVKVTIAWDDVPATPLVVPSLVNDIDLVVLDPAGGTHYPWTLDPDNPGQPAVRTQADHLNNIEQVIIDGSLPGVYRVQLTGTSIPQGPQSFGLMASPLLIQCSPAGLASLDRTAYGCGGVLGVQVVDCDLNTDDDTVDTVTVIVSSTSGGDVPLVLTESGAATASFAGSLQLGSDLIVAEGDSVQVLYTDADDGQGGTNVEVIDTAGVDCTGAEILLVDSGDMGPYEATIYVTTNEPTALRVTFGSPCGIFDGEAQNTAFATEHALQLTSLEENTTYCFDVEVWDMAGNSTEDDNGGNWFQFTTTDIPNFFTQQFSSGFDLDGYSVTFTPSSSVDEYEACAETITELPTPVNSGSSVSLSDDDSESRSSSQPVHLYGQSYSTIHIGSNGYITFNGGDTDYTESLSEHFKQPRISMLWDDLNPGSSGVVRFADLSDRAVVTFDNVPEYSNTGSNTFQCELFHNGVIRMSWLGIDSSDSIVGLSAGEGQSPDFQPSNLDGEDDCGVVIVGDVNSDGIVDVLDMLAVIAAWGPCVNCPEDIDGDWSVTVKDLLIVIANWGSTG